MPNPIRTKIIANPVAGGGSAKRMIPRLEFLMNRYHLAYELNLTEGHWQAVEMAREAALKGFEVVVAAGGDGTVNEVINGLMGVKDEGGAPPALGVLSIGRGNDFAFGMNIPAKLEEGIKTLAGNYRRQIDIGRVFGGLYPQGRYFGNCVGVGFDAIGTIEAAKLPRLGGFLSYLIAVLKTIFLYHQAPVSTVEYDGQSLTQPSLLVSIMNGRRLGGGFLMAPHGDPGDGLFDLCIAHQVSIPRIFTLIPHFLRGTQASQSPIRIGQASRVSIHVQEGVLPAQTDGEILCIDGQRLEIEMLPRQLEVICLSPGGVG